MPLSLPVPSFPCATGRESPVPGGATALPPAPGAGGKVPDLIRAALPQPPLASASWGKSVDCATGQAGGEGQPWGQGHGSSCLQAVGTSAK